MRKMFPLSADSFNPGVNNSPFALAVQTDGKVLVGGSFTVLGGQARTNFGPAEQYCSGTVDTAFTANASGLVAVAGIQTNGGILIGGQFTNVAGQSPELYRAVKFGRIGGRQFQSGRERRGKVHIAIQADGKIVLGGGFSMVAGQTLRNRLARLNADGSLDSAFDPEANNSVISLALQSDGKIVVSGYFTAIGGGSRTNTARLNADGTLDTTFDAGTNGPGKQLLIQADGKDCAGKRLFHQHGGAEQSAPVEHQQDAGRHVRKSEEDLPSSNYPGVYTMALQTDGKILVGGIYDTLGGASRSGLGRVNPNGVIDATYNPGTNSAVVWGFTDWRCNRMGRLWPAALFRCSAVRPGKTLRG